MAIRFNNHTSKIFRGSNQISKVYRGTATIYQLIMQAMYNEIAFTAPGTYTWVAPAGVTSVSVVAIGGGASGGAIHDFLSTGTASNVTGSAGGGLGWKNNIPVTPGQSYTVVVGAGGASVTAADNQKVNGNPGGDSYFIDTTTVAGFGGNGLNGGAYVGDGGGNGGSIKIVSSGVYNTAVYSAQKATSTSGRASGGAGAGGYSGDGGHSAVNGAGLDGAGGAGGAGAGLSKSAAAGEQVIGGIAGGTGLYGEGSSGVGGLYSTSVSVGASGTSGSGGSSTNSTSNPLTNLYGGGGYSINLVWAGSPNYTVDSGAGGNGAVRIIWGEGRSFPNNAGEQNFFDTYDDEYVSNMNLSNAIAGTDGTYAHVYSTDGQNIKLRRFDSSKNSISLTTVYTSGGSITNILSTMFANGSVLIALRDSNIRLLMVDSSNSVILNQSISSSSYRFGNISHNRAIDEVLVGIYTDADVLEAWKINNAGVYSFVQSVSGQNDLSVNVRPGLVAWLAEDRVIFYSVGSNSFNSSTWDMTNSTWVLQNYYIGGGSNITADEIKVVTRTWTPKESLFVYNTGENFININKNVYVGDGNESRLYTELGENPNIKIVDAAMNLDNQLGVIYYDENSGVVFYQEYDITDYQMEFNPTKFKYITNIYAWSTAPNIKDLDNPYGKMPITASNAGTQSTRIMFVEI